MRLAEGWVLPLVIPAAECRLMREGEASGACGQGRRPPGYRRGRPPLSAITISRNPGYGTGGPSITVFITLPGVFGSACVCAVAALHQVIVASGSVQADIGVGEGAAG